MSYVKKLMKNPAKIIYVLKKIKFDRLLSDKAYLKLMYRACIGKKLNLKDPKTFNEKLQWLKLYDRKPEYVKLVDKHDVKSYVADVIGEEYIIPTLGVWDSFDEIDFDKLPEKFVLKCTHDSGGLVICRDKAKLDLEAAKKKINKSLKRNFYYAAREWPYKNVKPRIIAEQYMEDSKTCELRDYKFYCFDGKPTMLLVASERMNGNKDVKFDFFDSEYNHLDITKGHPNADVTPEKPQNFEKMLELAKILSKGIPFLRVDFYEANGKIYFGELTFYPAGGFEPFEPDRWNFELGKMLELPATEKD